MIMFQEHKAKTSFSNFFNGNKNFKISDEKRTATTTIILDLEKYKINEKKTNQNSNSNSTQNKKTVVNISATPKKYHTFNENDSPSHKESSNKILINQISSSSPNNNDIIPNSVNGDIKSFKKPINKTNSSINTNNKNQPLIRKALREFLATPISQKEQKIIFRSESVEKKKTENLIIDDKSNRTTSPITKSLPSYDEALKRVSSETKNTKNKIASQFQKSSIVFINNNNNTNYHGLLHQNDQNGNTSSKNKNVLPNLQMQSTFKSLLSLPVNHSSPNNILTPNGSAAKVYFRPNNLINSNRMNSPTNQNINNELYIIQKKNIEKLNKPSINNDTLSSKTGSKLNRNFSSQNFKLNTSKSNESKINLDNNSENKLNNCRSSSLTSPLASNEQPGTFLQPNNLILNTNKLKSWSNLHTNNILQTNDKLWPEKTSSDCIKQNLTNWKFTAEQSNQTDKKIKFESDSFNQNVNQNNLSSLDTKNYSIIRTNESLQNKNKLNDQIPKEVKQKDLLINKKQNISNQNNNNNNNNENKENDKINKNENSTESCLELISDFSETQSIKNLDTLKEENITKIRTYETQNFSENKTLNKYSSNNMIDNTNQNKFSKFLIQNTNTNNTQTDPTLERPPGRLNYYDSDTNTISEGLMLASNLIKKPNNEYLKKNLNKDDGFTDSPSLSDITEGKFDDLEGQGHRTSTPNSSKRKRSTSLSTSEIKQIKKQIKELEKMYYEILRLIDPYNKSIYSENISLSSTSLSSLSYSYRDYDTKHYNENVKNFKDNNIKFTRMESHLTSLAKTVAQISLELKTIKSIEDVIYSLTKEVHELKKLNLDRLYDNDKLNDENELKNKICDLHRSSSEPNLISSFVSTKKKTNYDYTNKIKSLIQDKRFESQSELLDLKRNEFFHEKIKSLGPSYSNPKKLKKLTKFFGQEPPMLRLFLQKLNYEMYAQNFELEHITITELPYLSEERLKALGIPLGPRIRILKEAQLSFRQDNNLNIN